MFDRRIVSVDNNAQIETVVLLSQRKADDYVEVELELDELDLTSADRSEDRRYEMHWSILE